MHCALNPQAQHPGTGLVVGNINLWKFEVLLKWSSSKTMLCIVRGHLDGHLETVVSLPATEGSRRNCEHCEFLYFNLEW